MYEMAKSAREALKSKARRLAGADEGKVDATSVKRPAAFTASKKAGAAPVNPRAYKKGGAVKKREEGGAVTNPSEVANSMENLRETRTAKAARRALPPPSEAAARSGKAPQDVPGRKCGGMAKRPGRKSGGGVTVINIGKGASDAPMKVPAPAPVPMPMAQPPMQPAPMPAPQQMPPPAARNAPLALKTGGRANGGKTPAATSGSDVTNYGEAEASKKINAAMAARRSGKDTSEISYNGKPYKPGTFGETPRKAGGRVTKVAKSYKDMRAGAGSGEGRLQKTDIAKGKKRA